MYISQKLKGQAARKISNGKNDLTSTVNILDKIDA